MFEFVPQAQLLEQIVWNLYWLNRETKITLKVTKLLALVVRVQHLAHAHRRSAKVPCKCFISHNRIWSWLVLSGELFIYSTNRNTSKRFTFIHLEDQFTQMTAMQVEVLCAEISGFTPVQWRWIEFCLCLNNWKITNSTTVILSGTMLHLHWIIHQPHC